LNAGTRRGWPATGRGRRQYPDRRREEWRSKTDRDLGKKTALGEDEAPSGGGWGAGRRERPVGRRVRRRALREDESGVAGARVRLRGVDNRDRGAAPPMNETRAGGGRRRGVNRRWGVELRERRRQGGAAPPGTGRCGAWASWAVCRGRWGSGRAGRFVVGEGRGRVEARGDERGAGAQGAVGRCAKVGPVGWLGYEIAYSIHRY